VVFAAMFFIFAPHFVFAGTVYYDPTRNITIGWAKGTAGFGFYHIDDGTRQPATPNLADIVASTANDRVDSNFGFSSINNSNRSIVNMTLWVHTNTGSNAEYTFELYQEGVSVCSNYTPPNIAYSWRRCSWTAPSGSFENMSLYLGYVVKNGGGASRNANVSSAYLEVFEDFFPEVNLTNPQNNLITNISVVDFNFTVKDDLTLSMPNCSLWGNFTGDWAINKTIYNVVNNTNYNITSAFPDGNYSWNIVCFDERGNNNTYYENRTILIDTTRPIISIINPQNNSVNRTTNNIVFQYIVVDNNSITNCSIYINSEYNDSTANPERDTTISFSKYLPNGNYTWQIMCKDIANNTAISGLYYLNVSYFVPSIVNISMEQNISLNPGTVKYTLCNVSVFSSSSSDINQVSAVFKFSNNAIADPDDYNNHYTNSSCMQTGADETTKNFTCGFYLQYYAVNGTWHCNATATTTLEISLENSTEGIIYPLYAVNVSDILNYGDVISGQYSSEKTLQIINAGNMPINVSVRGYGGDNPVTGEGNAFSCAERNISIEHERYSLLSIPYNSKLQLTSSDKDMAFTLIKQTIFGAFISQDTFWGLYVPPGKKSQCSGTIVLTATNP
jgi:hypothetical protein